MSNSNATRQRLRWRGLWCFVRRDGLRVKGLSPGEVLLLHSLLAILSLNFLVIDWNLTAGNHCDSGYDAQNPSYRIQLEMRHCSLVGYHDVHRVVYS